MTVINTNIRSLLAANAITANEQSLQSAMTQLSTGQRINSAKDDAAGLAISSKMTAQINGLNMAVRNANDGISLLQTAEGATQEMTSMLQRMRELAVQSANDSNTTSDRSALDSEFQQLAKEITRIASNTQWNGMNILNNTAVGSSSSAGRLVKFQVGANANQTIDITLKDFSYGASATPVASEKVVDLAHATDNLKDAKTFTVLVNGHTFTASVATAVAASAATATEAASVAAALNTLISNTVGYESVTVTATGTQLDIKDPLGRGIGAANSFKAALAGGTAATIGANAVSQVNPGTTNGIGAAPSTANGVFSGTARLNNLDLTNITNSNTAITAVDNAVAAVNTQRSTMGSVMSRLQHAVNNLTQVSQNATESRSRVLDTDYADATTKLSKAQIIQQAATAMLAQANQQPQTVLALLK